MRKSTKKLFRRGNRQKYQKVVAYRTTHVLHQHQEPHHGFHIPNSVLIIAAFACGAVLTSTISTSVITDALHSVSVPTVSLPEVTLPSIQAPEITLPTITVPDLPALSLPTVTLPEVTMPTITLPTIHIDVLPIIEFVRWVFTAIPVLLHWSVQTIMYSVSITADALVSVGQVTWAIINPLPVLQLAWQVQVAVGQLLIQTLVFFAGLFWVGVSVIFSTIVSMLQAILSAIIGVVNTVVNFFGQVVAGIQESIASTDRAVSSQTTAFSVAIDPYTSYIGNTLRSSWDGIGIMLNETITVMQEIQSAAQPGK